MTTQRALLLKELSPVSPHLTLTTTQPIPTANPGSAVLHVLSTYLLPYQREVFTGARPYTLTLPLVPGNACIGRIHSVGPDAVSFAPGQLVFGDIAITARDDPNAMILAGLHGGMGPATKLMEGEWRDTTFAEYVRLPLENVSVLNEDVLCGKLGYSVLDLIYIPALMVPFGGLASADLKVGETIVVAPATGRFGGAAVGVALGMGARVVAAGRNEGVLSRMKEVYGGTGRLETVVMTGNGEVDGAKVREVVGGPAGADVYLDFSPPNAAKSSHIVACLGALRPGGRALFMGGIRENVEIPYAMVMLSSLRIQGRFMYERKDIPRLIKMVETGMVKLGKEAGITNLGPYKLENIEEALTVAEKNTAWGTQVVLTP